MKLLLDHGANPNARTTEDESALDWAIYKGDRAKIQILEQHGATRGNGPRQEQIPPATKGGISDPRVSLTRSMARLLDAAPGFRERTGCISCHHNAMPAWAAAAARGKGIEFDEVRARKTADDILTFFKSNMPRMMTGDPAVGGEALTAGYALLALAAGGHPSDTVTAAMMQWIMARQMPDGRWVGNGLNRPPSEYSIISHTAVAAGGLQSYPLPGRQSRVTQTLRRARQWLLAAKPASAEERAMRLMGLVWTDAARSDIAAAVRAVRADAGIKWWMVSVRPHGTRCLCDRFVLVCAPRRGVAPSGDTYRKGVAFLLGTQYQDGAWLVRTHSFPVQRYFESGFPFGRHQSISCGWHKLGDARHRTHPAGGRPGSSSCSVKCMEMSSAFKLAIVATAVGTVLTLAPVSGQTSAAVDKDWRPARTADGQPDIQGFWANQGRRLATYNIEEGADERHVLFSGNQTDHRSLVVDPADGRFRTSRGQGQSVRKSSTTIRKSRNGSMWTRTRAVF